MLYTRGTGGAELPPLPFADPDLAEDFITTYWNDCKSLQLRFLPPDPLNYSSFLALFTRATLPPVSSRDAPVPRNLDGSPLCRRKSRRSKQKTFK